jgi:hypothetical protein
MTHHEAGDHRDVEPTGSSEGAQRPQQAKRPSAKHIGLPRWRRTIPGGSDKATACSSLARAAASR